MYHITCDFMPLFVVRHFDIVTNPCFSNMRGNAFFHNYGTCSQKNGNFHYLELEVKS